MRVVVFPQTSSKLLKSFIWKTRGNPLKIFAGSTRETFSEIPQITLLDKSLSQNTKFLYSSVPRIDLLVNEIPIQNLQNFRSMKSHTHSLTLNVNLISTLHRINNLIPLLKKSNNPHIINICAPLNLNQDWFHRHFNLTLTHNLLSISTLFLAQELRAHKIAVNSIWSRKSTLKLNTRQHLESDLASAILKIMSFNSVGYTGNQIFVEDLLGTVPAKDSESSYLVGPYSESPYARVQFKGENKLQLVDGLNVLHSAMQKYVEANSVSAVNIVLRVGFPRNYVSWLFSVDGGVCELGQHDNSRLFGEVAVVKVSEGLFVNLLSSRVDPKYLEFHPNFSWLGTCEQWQMVCKCIKMAQESLQIEDSSALGN